MLQCVEGKALCNKHPNCRDNSDEEICNNYGRASHEERHVDTLPPAVIHMDGQGDYSIQPLTSFSLCPHTYFLCRGQSLSTHPLLVSRSVSVHTPTSCVDVSLSLCPHTHFLCPGQSLCVHTPTSCVQVSLSVSTHPLLVSRSVSVHTPTSCV